jgi:hypothetical protein
VARRPGGRTRPGGDPQACRVQVDQEINSGPQRLLPDVPELLDELLADGTADPWIDPVRLDEALRRADVDGESPRLNAALRRHAAVLERLCDTTWAGDYGPQVARKAIPLRGRPAVRGVLPRRALPSWATSWPGADTRTTCGPCCWSRPSSATAPVMFFAVLQWGRWPPGPA